MGTAMLLETPCRAEERKGHYEREFFILRDFISDRFGLHFPPNKFQMLYDKLQKVCRKTGIEGLAQLHQRLMEGDTSLLNTLSEIIKTNFTRFFREEKIFRFLQNRVLPALDKTSPPRIWSAASSTGEEAYTIAILLAEHFFNGGLPQQPVIIGTDISVRVLRAAEEAVYPEEALIHVPRFLREKYFIPLGKNLFQVCSPIRKLVVFRQINLMGERFPFQKTFDVIFCRNVFYYFDKQKQERVVNRLFDAASPGGWLFTSVTESLRDIKNNWSPYETGIHRKTAR